MVGNGCYVSDFFTQTEWGLLSSMSEKKQVAQHNIAVRLSYLDITSESQQRCAAGFGSGHLPGRGD